jgi:hypothetical protein
MENQIHKGFQIKCNSRPFTTKDIVSVCALVSERLGWVCEPEPISEGGIIISGWSGKTDEMYKSIRLFFNNEEERWPYIYAHTFQEWKDNEPIILRKKGLRIDTIVKSFHGAPFWTEMELRIFKDAIMSIGHVCINFPLTLLDR